MNEIQKQLDNTTAQMRKGLLEFCILLILSKDKQYASSILQTLKEANLLVVEGTLYPMLNRLKRSELLEYEWVESQTGPPRKYYFLTSSGRELLKKIYPTWKNLSGSINRFTNIYEQDSND